MNGMPKLCSSDLCCGCTACYAICPARAIAMLPDNRGFLHPAVDPKKCVCCHRCESVCPSLNSRSSDDAFACAIWAKDPIVKAQCSSGGAFYLIAQAVLQNGGVVYGAAMEEQSMTVKHVRVKSSDELIRLRGSKYVQSDLNNVLQSVQADLKDGRQVLFSGTPCQVSGLKEFLVVSRCEQMCHLYTIDLICYAIPSPVAFEVYKRDLQTEHGHIGHVGFRSKMFGWREYALQVDFDNGASIVEPMAANDYGRAFLKGYSTRRSCANCNSRGKHRASDLTLGDFWGVEHFPQITDQEVNTGVNIAVVHTDAGKRLVELVKSRTNQVVVDIDNAMVYNKPYFRSCRLAVRNKRFFAFLSKHGVSKSIVLSDRRTLKDFLLKVVSVIVRNIRRMFS